MEFLNTVVPRQTGAIKNRGGGTNKFNSNLKTPENHSAVLTMSTSAFSYKPLEKPTTE